MAFDIDDYTPEDLANASSSQLDELLQGFDLNADKYQKYFAKFDQTQIDNIVKNMQNQINELNIQSRVKLQGALSEGFTASQEFGRQSGFETSGDVKNLLQEQKDTIFKSTQQMQNLKTAGLKHQTEIAKGKEYRDYEEKFMTQLGNIETAIAAEAQHQQNLGGNMLGGTNKPGPCIVSTALNTTGAWSDSEKIDAVNWCQENHHDGTDRGKTWIKGYHTWGKFLAKWVKRSNIVRWVVDTTTTAFIDHTKRNKKNYLGWMIHNLWINPLSYVIGYSKKNKILGKIATLGMIGVYTLLFPLFAIISIPHVIKEKYGS